MHPHERLLGVARILQLRGQPLPADLLAEAERLGLSLTLFDQPSPLETEEGDKDYES